MFVQYLSMSKFCLRFAKYLDNCPFFVKYLSSLCPIFYFISWFVQILDKNWTNECPMFVKYLSKHIPSLIFVNNVQYLSRICPCPKFVHHLSNEPGTCTFSAYVQFLSNICPCPSFVQSMSKKSLKHPKSWITQHSSNWPYTINWCLYWWCKHQCNGVIAALAICN